MEVKVLTSRWKPKKKLGFLFDNLSMYELCRLNDIEIFEIGELSQDKITESIFYAAHLSYCHSRYIKPKYSRDQINEIVGSISKADGDALSVEMLNSQVFGKKVSEWNTEGVKKK